MLTRLLLVCVAAASAVPLPNPASTSTVIGKKPSSDGPAIDITSKLSSAVVTGGGAQVTTSGSTSGAAAVTTKIEGPGVSSTITAVGQGGISGTSATAGDSASVQKGRSKTVVEATSEGTEVITGTEGKGITQGLAAAEQKAGAEGGAKRVTVTKFIESDGKGLYEVEKVDQSTVRSASGHQASSKRFGTFKVLNLGATAVNTAGLVALPQATEPAESEPSTDYWTGGHKSEPKPVPAPEPKPVIPSPKKKVSSESKAKQIGQTTGLGAVSATGGTQGTVQSQTKVETPEGASKEAAVVNSGVSLTGVSSGDGTYKQKAQGKTEVTSTDQGVDVTSTSGGQGETDGAAGTIQAVGTNGGFTAVDTLNLKLPSLEFGGKRKASGTSTSGHKASSSGPGRFITKNEIGTQIKLKDLDLDTIALPVPHPTTKPPKFGRLM